MQRALVAATKDFCDAFRIDLPIIQAPMAGVQEARSPFPYPTQVGLDLCPVPC